MHAPHTFLAKANESLVAARVCFAKDLFNVTANRTYYACAQAVAAGLIQKNRLPAKPNHDNIYEGFLTLYQHSLPKLPKILLNLRSHRETADYKETNITKRQALDCLADANDFVSQLSQNLGRK